MDTMSTKFDVETLGSLVYTLITISKRDRWTDGRNQNTFTISTCNALARENTCTMENN